MARKSTAEAIGNRRKQRPAPQQMDLFAARITGGAPDWPDLPEEAREALVSLMTRLIWSMRAQPRRRQRSWRPTMISDKIGPHHLERKAILYVRQSRRIRWLHNRGERRVAIRHADRLTALGFIEIEVIDEDLGRSAAGGVQRAGFERWWPRSASEGWRSLRPGGLALRPQ